MDQLEINTARLMAKIRTIAAFSYKKSIGQPIIYPQDKLAYCANFLNMMFAVPAESYEADPEICKALDLLLILHADHEQNCSASTVRVVGSSMANVYASVASGILALWGPLHGGANQQVLRMLERNLARRLEEVALSDEYFIERKLYPNVDFYSGIIYRAIGIPENMFTVMFALGRLPGWIAQWKEMHEDPKTKIARPRQIYTGENTREYVPIENRVAG